MFYDAECLNSKVTARSLPEPSEESYSNVKCYACEVRKVSVCDMGTGLFEIVISLNIIYSLSTETVRIHLQTDASRLTAFDLFELIL